MRPRNSKLLKNKQIKKIAVGKLWDNGVAVGGQNTPFSSLGDFNIFANKIKMRPEWVK